MPNLTTLEVKYAKPGRHVDGRGLYLLVRPSSAKSWVLRIMINGNRRDYGLGSANKVSVAQARTLAAEMRVRLEKGIFAPPPPPPMDVIPNFSLAARACHDALKSGWRNARHRDSWLVSLEQHIYPAFGAVPVDQVTTAMVRDALAPIWLKIPETARRILQRIRTVLDFAHISGWCLHEASLRSVSRALPRQPTEENHYESLPYTDVPALVGSMKVLPETAGRDALLFTILTAARSGETRGAIWPEIDIEKATWSLPASRMKMKRPHVVPLSPPALEILKRRWHVRGEANGLVFSTHGTRPISDMTMTKQLRDLKHAKITVHGFRSSFTDWAAELTDYRKEVVDKALAHKLIDRVEAAYRRTDFFDRRRALMDDWADFITSARRPQLALAPGAE